MSGWPMRSPEHRATQTPPCNGRWSGKSIGPARPNETPAQASDREEGESRVPQRAPVHLARPSAVGRSYTEQEVEDGDWELAYCGGNSRMAARRLERRGNPVPRETLRDWGLPTHRERYEEIRGVQLAAIREQPGGRIGPMAEVDAMVKKMLD
jgi:hypothetical protein